MVAVGPESEAHPSPSRYEDDRSTGQVLPGSDGRCHRLGALDFAGAPTAPTKADARQEGGDPEAEEHREKTAVLLAGRLPCPDHHSVGHPPLWCELDVWPLEPKWHEARLLNQNYCHMSLSTNCLFIASS